MTTTTAPSPPTKRKKSKYARKDLRIAAFLILPTALAIFIVMILPLGFALFASTFEYSQGRESEAVFVFFDNYASFFADPVAMRSLGNTIVFTILSLSGCLVIGVGMAVLLKSLKPRVGNVLRAVFVMPLLISPIIVSLIWRYMYDPTYGLIYYVLGLVGLEDKYGGLTDPATALFSIAVTDIWHAVPFIILVASAGLTVIPEELYEAARIDGAGALRTLFNVTLPLMTKVLVVLVLIRGTDAFRVFDLIYGLTGGGPANSTASLSIYAYRQAYENNQMGYAMAVGIITLVGLVIIFGPFMRNSARGKDN